MNLDVLSEKHRTTPPLMNSSHQQLPFLLGLNCWNMRPVLADLFGIPRASTWLQRSNRWLSSEFCGLSITQLHLQLRLTEFLFSLLWRFTAAVHIAFRPANLPRWWKLLTVILIGQAQHLLRSDKTSRINQRRNCWSDTVNFWQEHADGKETERASTSHRSWNFNSSTADEFFFRMQVLGYELKPRDMTK